jgi:hypothetical protein
MTDTAKPTPGPWYYVPYPSGIGGFVNAGDPSGPAICDLSKHEQPETNGRFIAEAGTVFHETGLTPRQLAELYASSEQTRTAVVKRMSELAEQRDDLEAALFHLYDYALDRGHDDDFPLQISILIRQSYEAALAKCGKVGG